MIVVAGLVLKARVSRACGLGERGFQFVAAPLPTDGGLAHKREGGGLYAYMSNSRCSINATVGPCGEGPGDVTRPAARHGLNRRLGTTDGSPFPNGVKAKRADLMIGIGKPILQEADAPAGRERYSKRTESAPIHSPWTNLHNLNRAGILSDASVGMSAWLRLGTPAGGIRPLWMNPSRRPGLRRVKSFEVVYGF